MSMQLKIQLVSIVVTAGLFGVIFELLRRKRLMERYALLWLFSSIVILVLAVWSNALELIARQLGIVSAPNALFFVALGFVLLLLLHFSAAMSRLADQSKVLAQRQAILEHKLRELERAAPEDQRELEPLVGSRASDES